MSREEGAQALQPASPTRPAQGRKRIGVVLNGLQGKANTVALRYLILEMNRVQSTFEYEFLPTPDDPWLALLRQPGPTARSEVKAGAADFFVRHQSYLCGLNTKYSLMEAPPDYVVVVCLTTFDDTYYSTRSGGVSVIALGNWQRHMAPPSIVEFLLTLIVREAVASVSPTLRGSVHLGTKGCVFDFTLALDDVRFKVLSGLVCLHCRGALITDNLPQLAQEVQSLSSKKWLGLSSQAGTPAAIAAKLGHDLFTTKGLQATRWEKLLHALSEEGAKQVLVVLGVVVAAVALAWLGLKP
jgi:hypothetical protein